MFALALAVGVPQRRVAGIDWWRTADRRLDGVEPSAALGVPIGGAVIAGADATFSDFLTVSSGSKRAIGPTGTLDIVAANAVAFDWSSGRRRLLIEAAPATNLCPHGRSPGLAGWVCRGVTPIAGVDDPTGGADAVRMTLGAPVTRDVYQVVGIGAANARYEPSIFVRKQSGGILRIDGAAAPGIWAVDLSLLGNGYERITRSHPAVTVIQEFVSGAGWLGGIDLYAQSGTVTVDLYGAQYELGAVSTSLIVTNGAAATRIADDVRLSAAVLAQVTGAGGCTIAVRGSAEGADWMVGGQINGAILTGSGLYRSDFGGSISPSGWADHLADFGIAFTAGSGERRASANGSPVVSAGGSPLWDLSDETGIRLGSPYNGWYPTTRLFLDELVIWPFVGSDAGIRAQARTWA